ncbi:hypothetical protein B0H14DRAFT_2557284 [Mycena olivaceomarginata]|nr:hypothetical protein B0H14DRAFT_2557284 [Mycena olivaceomarginata]
MVGQWAGDPDLIAVEEFETQLAEGWSRKKKRKADIPPDGQAALKVIVVADNSFRRIFIFANIYSWYSLLTGKRWLMGLILGSGGPGYLRISPITGCYVGASGDMSHSSHLLLTAISPNGLIRARIPPPAL